MAGSTSRRRFVVASLAVMLASACVARPQPAPRQVLFVCQAGTAKSAIARELFLRRARERGIEVAAISRGIKIEDHISPTLRQRLLDDRINTQAEAPQVLTPADLWSSTLVVVFNPLPKDLATSQVRDWTDLPSVNESYDAARAILDQRIEALLDELSKPAG